MFHAVKYGRKSFSLTPYTTAEERDILISATINEDKNIDEIFNYLSHHITPQDPSLTPTEKKLLLFKLRYISIGETVNAVNKCPHCKRPFDIALSLENFVTGDEKESQINIDGIEFYIKQTFDDTDIYNRIEKILKKDINSSNIEDIIEAIDNLEFSDYDKLEDFINNNSIKIEFTNISECYFCKKNIEHDMSSDKYVIECLSEDSLVSFYKSITNLVYFGHFSKLDIDSMFPFERSIYNGLVQANINEYNNSN
jgi:hypothetical protein